MKAYIEKIKTYLERFKKAEKYTKDSLRASRDWTILLSVASVATLFCAVFAFYVYVEVSHGTLSTAPAGDSGTSAVMINENLLQKTVQNINARSATFSSLQQQKLTVPDPSI